MYYCYKSYISNANYNNYNYFNIEICNVVRNLITVIIIFYAIFTTTITVDSWHKILNMR